MSVFQFPGCIYYSTNVRFCQYERTQNKAAVSRSNFRERTSETRDLWGSAPNPGGNVPLQLSRTNKQKITNFSSAKPCPFVRHKRNRTKAVRPPAILADQQALRGIYGALPQTPSAFLEKAEEKQYFTAKYPTHSVRAAAKRRCNTRGQTSENNKVIFRETVLVFVP